MPRIAKPKPVEVDELIALFQEYCDNESVNVSRLAKLSNVSQSALARFVGGERKTVTVTARRVLAYINKQHKTHRLDLEGKMMRGERASATNPLDVVNTAIRTHWDGSRAGAELLAAVIAAAFPLLRLVKNIES